MRLLEFGTIEITSLIDKVADKHGRYNLAAGNCGTFAMALAQYLKTKGIQSSISVLYRWIDDLTIDDNPTIDDLAGEEPDIYHITLTVGGKMYDARGETNIDDMIELSNREYRDSSPGWITNIGIDELAIMTLVEHDTNWSISINEFYNTLEN